MLSLFLVGLGARLWLIHRFGTPLPFWDQWEQARVVYIPFFEGKLSVANLFSPHNEHRILFSRLYGLLLLLLNRQWDGQLEMATDAVIHCATMASLGWLMSRWVEKKYWILLWLPLAVVLALPFGWENSLAGFQSIFYFFLLLSLLTLWLLLLYPPGSARWWCGVAAAILALFTLASAFLAAAAVCALVALHVARQPRSWKQQAPTLAICAIVVIAGFLLKVDVKHHHVLQAHSVKDFVMSFAENLAWPWIVVPPFALLNLLPLAVLGWHHFKDAEDGHPAGKLTLAIGLWTILQGAAAAYARGAGGKLPDWRYMDTSSLILVADCFSIALLMGRYLGTDGPRTGLRSPSPSLAGLPPAVTAVQRDDRKEVESVPVRLRPKAWLRIRASWLIHSAWPLLLTAFILWGLASSAGLVLLTLRAWQIDIPERELYSRAQLKYTRAFMATDSIHVFDRVPKPELPYYQGNPLAPQPAYEAKLIVDYLRNPLIREILPACARLPLDTKPDPQETHGFVTNGFRLARRHSPTEASWGSYSAAGSAGTGVFESLPIRESRLPYLEISVAGDLGNKNLSLELVDLAGGRREPVRPSAIAGGTWLECYVRAPAGRFKIVARDASKTGWFAFQPPREVGRLSFWAIQTLRGWKYFLVAGLGLFFFEFTLTLGRKPAP